MVLQSSAKKWRLRDLEINCPGTVDITAGKPPRIEKAPGLIQAVRVKTAGSHVALRRNFSGLVSATDLVKSSKDSASLVVRAPKKICGWLLWIL